MEEAVRRALDNDLVIDTTTTGKNLVDGAARRYGSTR